MHFVTRKSKIRATIETWAKSTPTIRNYTPSAGRNRFMELDDEVYFTHSGAVQRRAAPKKASIPKGIDLLDMFDEGITEIEAWKHDNARD